MSIAMPTTRHQAVFQRLDEEAGESTIRIPPTHIDQREPHDEANTQVSGTTPLPSEWYRETNVPSIPPPPNGFRH